MGKAVTKQDYDRYQQQIGVFRTWFGDNIGPIAEPGDSWTAMVLPVESAAPNYRDESSRYAHTVQFHLHPLLTG